MEAFVISWYCIHCFWIEHFDTFSTRDFHQPIALSWTQEANISEDVKLPALFRTEPFIICVAAPIRTNLWMPVGTDAEKEVRIPEFILA